MVCGVFKWRIWRAEVLNWFCDLGLSWAAKKVTAQRMLKFSSKVCVIIKISGIEIIRKVASEYFWLGYSSVVNRWILFFCQKTLLLEWDTKWGTEKKTLFWFAPRFLLRFCLVVDLGHLIAYFTLTLLVYWVW